MTDVKKQNQNIKVVYLILTDRFSPTVTISLELRKFASLPPGDGCDSLGPGSTAGKKSKNGVK